MSGPSHYPLTKQRSIGATRMYRTVSGTHPGNLYGSSKPGFSFSLHVHRSRTIDELRLTRRLTFLETSRDETTGAIRFRRRTWAVSRAERQSDGSASTTALRMDRLYRPKPQSEERYEAGEIELEDESKSTRDGDHSVVVEGKRSRTECVHDK